MSFSCLWDANSSLDQVVGISKSMWLTHRFFLLLLLRPMIWAFASLTQRHSGIASEPISANHLQVSEKLQTQISTRSRPCNFHRTISIILVNQKITALSKENLDIPKISEPYMSPISTIIFWLRGQNEAEERVSMVFVRRAENFRETHDWHY